LFICQQNMLMQHLNGYLTWLLIFILKESNILVKCNGAVTEVFKEESYFVRNTVVNEHNFKYLLNPGDQVCRPVGNQSVFLLVYVHSAPQNFKRRLSLRETWAKRSMFRDMRIVFMMGYVEEKKLKDLLLLESNTYNDIVQEDFIDAYKNLTYKGIMSMKWISQHCPQTKYILKVDDDMLTNVFILMRHLYSLDKHNIVKSNSIMCLVWIGMVVMREKDSKWYLSKEEFGKDVFDKYCSGSAYLLTNDLPKRMFERSKYIKFFWVDDYYMTGLLARGVNASYVFFNSLYIINTGLVEQRFLGKTGPYTVFGHLPGALSKVYTLWDYILSTQLNMFPHLYLSEANLLLENDFKYLKNFRWSYSIWERYLKTMSLEES
jgi:hypothetical protein